MKKTKLALSLLTLSIFSSTGLNAQEINPHYIQEMNMMADNIEMRLAELREIAKNPDYLTYKDGKKYLTLNEIEYEINKYGNVELPLAHWSDTSAIRNLFNFFDQNWELSSFQGGAVFVNLKYGNYDYGKGCLLEYYPKDLFDTNNLLRETFSCQDADQAVNNDQADYLNPFDFALASQSKDLIAMDKSDENLAIINSSSTSASIGIRNIQTKTSKRITGINGKPYTSLSDVRFFDAKLFVISSKENRIDVFNPETTEHLYSLNLSGYQNNSGKIAINEQFIMVTAENSILVYPNTFAASSDKLVLEPIAKFNYATQEKPHSLEIINDKLIAVSSESTAVYSMAAIAQERVIDAEIIAQKGFEAFDINEDQIIGKEKHRVAFYDLNQWLNNGYQFNEASKALYLVDDFYLKPNDLIVEQDSFYSMNDSLVQRVHDLSVISFDKNASVATKALTFAALPQSSVSPIFSKGMTQAQFHDLSTNTSSLVNVRLLDNKTVEIANYTEFDLSGLDLDIKALDQHEYARLATMDYIPAFTKVRLPLSYFNSELEFKAASGRGVYNYTKMLAKLRASTYGGSYSVQNMFSSRFATVSTNEKLEKIKQITADWKISFRNSTFSAEMEKAWTVETAKSWLKLITNMAYVMSSEQFANRWMNFKAHYGYEMHNVPGYHGEFDQKAYASFLSSMQTNAFTLIRKAQGFQTKSSIRGEVGSLFGMSDSEFEKVLSGDLITFATYYGDQINRNYFMDCLPNPCDKDYDLFVNKEKGFAPMFVDVVELFQANGGLVY